MCFDSDGGTEANITCFGQQLCRRSPNARHATSCVCVNEDSANSSIRTFFYFFPRRFMVCFRVQYFSGIPKPIHDRTRKFARQPLSIFLIRKFAAFP